MLHEKAKKEVVETVEFFLNQAAQLYGYGGKFKTIFSVDNAREVVKLADLMLRQYTAEMAYWDPNETDDSGTPFSEDDDELLEEQAFAILKRLYGKIPQDFIPGRGYWRKEIYEFEDETIIEVIVTIPAKATEDIVRSIKVDPDLTMDVQ